MVTRLVAGLVAIPLTFTDLSAAVTVWTERVVRVYDNSGLSLSERTRALTAARAALATAPVDVVWSDCTESDACQARPAPRELIVRLVNGRTPEAGARVPLGEALVDAGEHTGVLATVYVNRVHRVAATLGTDGSVLLGRAIAHELGHLLAGSSTHARAGLMRRTWTLAEILRDRREDWIFR